MVLIWSLLLDPALSTPPPGLIQWRLHDVSNVRPLAVGVDLRWLRWKHGPCHTVIGTPEATSSCSARMDYFHLFLLLRLFCTPKTGERIGIQPCEIFCDDVAPCSFCDSGVRFAHVHSGQPRGRRHFERGEILEVVIITDKGTGRSNGGGFVSTHPNKSLFPSSSTDLQ